MQESTTCRTQVYSKSYNIFSIHKNMKIGKNIQGGGVKPGFASTAPDYCTPSKIYFLPGMGSQDPVFNLLFIQIYNTTWYFRPSYSNLELDITCFLIQI